MALSGRRRCRSPDGANTSRPTLVPDPLFVVAQGLGRRHWVIAPAYPPAGMMADLHGALFTHTDQYLDLLQAFLADPVSSPPLRIWK